MFTVLQNSRKDRIHYKHNKVTKQKRMSVVLRKRKNSDGSTTLLLDIYHNGKRSYEFLKELKLLKPSTPIHRQENKERILLAEQIRNKREQLLQGSEYEITPSFKKQVDFVAFFRNFLDSYKKKDRRVVKGCLERFCQFMADEGISSLSTKEMTENMVIRFKDYLESHLHGESPSSYFKKFKKLLKHGVREKIFERNPSQDIVLSRGTSIKKDILTGDEIQLLAKTPLLNQEVKMAFLFCCNTGLRFCDVKELKWTDIVGGQLKIVQGKTGVSLTVNLNANAIFILDTMKQEDRKGKMIFQLPSHTACLKNLKTWCKAAVLEKKITWHCARHSFGTNMVYHGADVNTASSNLGHTSLVYTQRYVRVVEELKQRAVDNLPKIEFAK